MLDTASAGSRRTSDVTSEIRIGLAMSGAIALVLYEAGVTHEVFRLAKAWDAHLAGRETASTATESGSEGYFECLGQIPMRPVIDILTGASAGAVNSSLLASCLSGGTDFVRYHDILLTKLDVKALKFKKNDPPNSLMDSRILLDVLEKELQRNVDAGSGSPPGRGLDLCIRLCRTHLAGHCETTRDAIGHQIDVDTRSDVIEFSGKDFLDSGKVTQIAKATMASAAFPGAFGPVFDEKDRVWYVDGGLWDNQPVDWAVDAVRDKPAFVRTHRCILFVEPNPPGRPVEQAKPGGEPEPALADILMAVPFMGVKGNVWPAIRDLFDFNRRSTIYSRLVRERGLRGLTRQLGGQWLRDSVDQLDKSAAYPTVLSRGTCRSLEAVVPTILNQVRLETTLLDNDPALIQRWHAINEAWNALRLRLSSEIDSGIFFDGGIGSGSEQDPTPASLAAIAALRAVGWNDMLRRAVRRRIDRINDSLGKPRPSQEPGGVDQAITRRKYALYLQLEKLNDYLFTSVDPSTMPPESAQASAERPRDAGTTDWPGYHSRLVRFHSRFRTVTVQMLNDLEFAFRYLFRVPATASTAADQQREIARVLADPMKNPITALNRWIEGVSAEADKALRESGLGSDAVAGRLGDGRPAQVTALLNYNRPLGVSTEVGDGFDGVIRWAASTRFTKVDAVRHVLAAVSDLSSKRPVDLVRVSPNDTNNLYLITCDELVDETPARRKLAGEGLGHLQGFLEERWRRNDYIWGRLDACEILLRTMRLYAEREGMGWTEQEYEDALYNAQNAILKQEADLYNQRLGQLGKRAQRKWAMANAQTVPGDISPLAARMAPARTPHIGAIHRSKPLESQEGDSQ